MDTYVIHSMGFCYLCETVRKAQEAERYSESTAFQCDVISL